MARHLRRLLPIAIAAVLFASVAPPAAAADLTVSQAEAYLASLLNQHRVAHGLVPLRVDLRVRAVARARSADMAARHYFGHRNSDGRYAWDMMGDAGITWYWAGEIIAWNTWGTLADSARAAARGWRDSSAHNALVLGRDYNYFGVGYAYDSTLRRKLWTTVFLKGPDRTRAWSRMRTPVLGSTSAGGRSRLVSLYWGGADVRLQVLTSGLHYFQVSRRVDGGTWRLVISATTATSWRVYLARGHRYDYIVRAVDRARNRGYWTRALTIRP
jgi:uncharacterized protein YkwD